MHDGVTVADLADAVGGTVVGDATVRVVDATHDSRCATLRSLFISIRGRRRDGHHHVGEAVARGASAVCVEEHVGIDVPQLMVADTRAAMPHLAARIHGMPSRHLSLVGVTGTDGKTTVVHLTGAVLEAAGRRVGLIGTVGAVAAGEKLPLVRTTPEATDWQRLLAHMVQRGVDTVAAEVSSHALELHRVEATRFAVAAFTNLTQDHLDFHGTMDAYFAAKTRLFTAHDVECAVVWTDDEWGRRLAGSISLPVMTVGRDRGDVHARNVELRSRRIDFNMATPSGAAAVSLPLSGDFQLDNALIAAACCLTLGLKPADVASGLNEAVPVPGRFEPIDGGQGFLAIVDYAHTPAAIERAVGAARRCGARRVIVAVGAGGDRDHSKRHLMGRAAASADIAVVTSDNPRSEDPASIVDAVAAGAEAAGASPVREPDRRRAIRWALAAAGPGDAVLVLGKGHETGQDLGDRVMPFDDRVVVREELDAL